MQCVKSQTFISQHVQEKCNTILFPPYKKWCVVRYFFFLIFAVGTCEGCIWSRMLTHGVAWA